MRGGSAARSPVGAASCARLRAGFAPRAPHWGRSAPPNRLQRRPVSGSSPGRMPPLCPELAYCLPLDIAHKQARQAFSKQVHRIGVPRGNAPGRECRGRGRPLPPPAQGNLHLSKGRNQGRPRECAPCRRATSKAAPSCYNSAPTRSARSSLCLSCRWQRVESQPAA